MSGLRRGTHCDLCGGLVARNYEWRDVDGRTAWLCARCSAEGSGLTPEAWGKLCDEQVRRIRSRWSEAPCASVEAMAAAEAAWVASLEEIF